jgi:hypothetical protein
MKPGTVGHNNYNAMAQSAGQRAASTNAALAFCMPIAIKMDTMANMNNQSKPLQAYLKFLRMAQSVREMPEFPGLGAVEERMMNMFGARWQRNQQVTVIHAMTILPEISPATAHRRLKELQKMDWIALDVNEVDNRVKFVVPTDLTLKYFSELGKRLAKAGRR